MELTRGQRQRMSDAVVAGPISVGIEIDSPVVKDLVLFCLLVDAQEALLHGDEAVFASHGASRCGGVRADGPATFAVDLAKVPGDAHRLVFALGVSEAGRARGLDASKFGAANITLKAGDEAAFVYKLTETDLGAETALCLIEIYRKDGWRVTATGAGFLGGIPSMIARYRGKSEVIFKSLPPTDKTRAAAPPVAAPTGSDRAVVARAWATRGEPAVPASLIPGVGLVIVELEEGSATGTGFMLGPGGYFLTCAHVVAGHRSVAIRLEGAQNARPATVVRLDEEGDLALLHINDRDGVLDWLLLAGPDFAPALGDNLGLLGFPLGGDLGISLTYSQGVINSLRKSGDIPVLQVDTGAAPGSSGGPVFRRSDGRVVGLLTSGLTRLNGGMLVNFAVDIRRVWQLGWVT